MSGVFGYIPLKKVQAFKFLLTTKLLFIINYCSRGIKTHRISIKDFNSDTYTELMQTFDRSVKPRGCLHGGREILEGESSLHHMFSVFY